jgi:hypothetical protein
MCLLATAHVFIFFDVITFQIFYPFGVFSVVVLIEFYVFNNDF